MIEGCYVLLLYFIVWMFLLFGCFILLFSCYVIWIFLFVLLFGCLFCYLDILLFYCYLFLLFIFEGSKSLYKIEERIINGSIIVVWVLI